MPLKIPVPFWGFYFSILPQEYLFLNNAPFGEQGEFTEVLVPSRGYLFLNETDTVNDVRGCVLVPSRGYLFLNVRIFHARVISCVVLVPSRGYLFLNDTSVIYRTFNALFSSPLGDIYFSMILP